MKNILRVTALAAVVLGSLSAATRAADLYVSPGGKDSDPGTPARPLATLEGAREAIRRMKANGPLPPGGVTVHLGNGIYSRQSSFALGEQDSGTEAAPITYQASPGGDVELVGGRVLHSSDFQPVTDPADLRRLDPSARGKMVGLNLAALGVAHAGPYPDVFSNGGGTFELFFNGARMPVSRWPNTGYVTMKRVLVNGDAKTPGVFEYREDRPARWSAGEGIWLRGKWRVGWEDPAIKVAKIDPATHQITFAAGIPLGIGNKYTRPAGNGREPYCAINLVEEIDRPGEWAIDFAAKRLFFWPPAPLETAHVLLSQLDAPLITLDHASHIRLIGLTLDGSLGDGIVLHQGSGDLIAGCTIRNLAGRGVLLDGDHNGVQSCDLYGLGQGCVYVSGGDKLTLTPAKNFVINNHLHDYAVLQNQYSPAVQMGFKGSVAVGNLVAHNLIHHAPRDAVVYGGEDNVFEYNEIHSCAYDTADTGAFYAWNDWTIRGTVIRYNFIHDTVGGVNPDDGATGADVYGNIFAGPRVGVWIASGADYHIHNNIFVKDAGPVFGMDDRGVSRGYAHNAGMIRAMQAVRPDQAPWSIHFPQVVGFLQNHPELPWDTVFSGNLICIQSGEPYALHLAANLKSDPKIIRADGNFVTHTDPGFMDAAHENYALKKDSPAFTALPGFVPIPTDKIGLFVDEYRLRLPTPAEAGYDRLKTDSSSRKFGT